MTYKVLVAICLWSLASSLQGQVANCTDGLKNGDETGIDCGGTVCQLCPCDGKDLTIETVTEDVSVHLNNVINTISNGIITNNVTTCYTARNYIELNPEFSIDAGVTAEFAIEDCVESTPLAERGFSQDVYDSHSNPTYPADAVFASSFGYNPTDATDAYYNAIGSDNDFIVIDNVGGSPTTYTIDPRRIFNLANKTIVFEAGVTVTQISGSLSSKSNDLLQIFNSDNVDVYGYGATLALKRAQLNGESNHCIGIEGSRNIGVYGLHLVGVGGGQGGDGVYVTGTTIDDYCEDIVLEDITTFNQGRQGMSIISVVGLEINNCKLENTNGRFPRAGIDFEGNHADDKLQNCVVNHVTSQGNHSNGIVVALYFMNSVKGSNQEETSKTNDISITIKNTIIKDNVIDQTDNGTGTFFYSKPAELAVYGSRWKDCTGFVNLDNVEIITDKSHAIGISKRSDDVGYLLDVKNTIITMTGDHKEPLLINDGSWNDWGLGGCVFDNVCVSTTQPTSLLRANVGGSTYVQNMTGTINIDGPTTNSIVYGSDANSSLTQNFNIAFSSEDCVGSTLPPDPDPEPQSGRGFSQAVYDSHSNPTYPADAVFASSFGYNPTDATDAYYNAIGSDNDFIVIDNVGGSPTTYNIDPRRIFNLANKTIVFEAGVTVTQISGSLLSKTTDLLQIFNSDDVDIYGYGATLALKRAQLIEENNHCLSIEGSRNIRIYGFNLIGVGSGRGGDGVYITGTSLDDYSENIVIEDIITNNQSRQGISIISVVGLEINNCKLENTNGRFPRAGIDFEGDHADHKLQNCVVNHVTAVGNHSNGIIVALYFMNSVKGSYSTQEEMSKTNDISITIKNTIIKDNVIDQTDNGTGGFFYYKPAEFAVHGSRWKDCTGFVNLDNVEIITDKSHAIGISKRSDDVGYQFNVKNTIITMTGNHKEPFLIPDGSWYDWGLGGCVFDNVCLSTTQATSLLRANVGGNTYVKNITGNLIIDGPTTNTIVYGNDANSSLTQNFNVNTSFGSCE